MKRIPFVQQTTATDCGAACLTMTLRYHGKCVGLQEVRRVASAERDGTDVLALLDAARQFGFEGRGLRLELDQLRFLRPGSILHWRFHHFVVFERWRRDGAVVVDPSSGRRFVPLAELSSAFTGVALELAPGESFERSGAPPTHLVPYLRKVLEYRGILLRVAATTFLLQVLALVLPVSIGILVDRVVPRRDLNLLVLLAVGALVFTGFQSLAMLIRLRLFLHLRVRLDARLTLDFLEHLFALPFSFFQTRTTGDLLMRLNSNIAVREIVTSSALSALMDGSLVGLYLVLLFATSPAMCGLVLLLGLLRVGLFLATRARRRELLVLELRRQMEAQAYQVQMLSGIHVIKASGTEGRVTDHWRKLFLGVLDANLVLGRMSAGVDTISGAVATLSPLAVLIFGTVQVLQGDLTLGTMLAVNALAAGFLGPLGSLVTTASELQTAGTHLERIGDVLDTPREQVGGERAHTVRGRLTFESVSFRYGADSPDVLEDISFEIDPGEFVAVVGRSGAGKSTLFQLVIGLYRPGAGRILYDGAEQSQIDLRQLRRSIGVVPQHTFLFGTSLRENITLADPTLPLETVVEAAKLAAIHDEIMELPLGYETLLDDRGAGLSGGQRQRLALARALVGRPAILLLDEATSELDPLTEQRVQACLAGVRCSRLVIAHRLSTIRSADRILVLDRGRLVEQGRHAELLARHGLYAALVAAIADDPSSLGAEELADSCIARDGHLNPRARGTTSKAGPTPGE